MNVFLLRVFLFLLFSGSAFAQEEKVVAKVGSYKIYESEFRDRFDFSAKPKLLNKKDRLDAKKEFLKQLIAEKLLSLEAKEKGYHTSETFSDIITPLENMFVRDALYSQEIKSKTTVIEEDISEGINRITKTLTVKFLHSLDLKELQDIHYFLNSGASFDSLLSLRPEAEKNPKDITFGTMDKEVEDFVYKLKPGEFTHPIESKDGYYILKLIDVKENPAPKDRGLLLEDVKRIVQTRAEYKVYVNHYRSFFNDKKVTADKEIFEALIKVLIPKFNLKYIADSQNTKKFFLRGSEITSAFYKIDQEVPFIKTKNPIKLKVFLNQLSHDGLYVTDPDERSIRSSLSAYIRKFIEDQLLTEEGIRMGLHSSKDVRQSLIMWEDAYLSKFLTGEIFDSIQVSDEEALTVYQQNEWKDTPLQLVNIVEIFTDSLQIIAALLDELSKGKDIKELAYQYTKRDSLKDKYGEFGYFPVTRHGQLGKIASQMNVGDVYGPLQIDDGYSIFKLTGKKEDENLRNKPFDEVKEDIISYLRLQKFQDAVNKLNSKLAQKYGVEINEDVLEGIDNIYLNLVVVRYMGFGGEIFAVPYTEQFPGWYELWQQSKLIAP